MIKERSLIIPRELIEKIRKYCPEKEGVNGVVIARELNGLYLDAKRVVFLGTGDLPNLRQDDLKADSVYEFLRRHDPVYRAVDFHTHDTDRLFSEREFEMLQKASRKNQIYTHLLVTPNKQALYGAHRPDLFVSTSRDYQHEGTAVKHSLDVIAKKFGVSLRAPPVGVQK